MTRPQHGRQGSSLKVNNQVPIDESRIRSWRHATSGEQLTLTMFQSVQLPASITDLDTGLSDVEGYDFTLRQAKE